MEKIIAVNQKMFFTSLKEVEKYQNDLKEYRDKFIVFPADIYLKSYIDKGFLVGSQNISNFESGPYTGEISAKSVKDLGANYVIIGHSEIRKRNKNEEKLIQDKIKIAQKNNLKIIICIGEKYQERENKETLKVIKKQLEGIDKNVIVSYEPVWSVGSKKTPSTDEIDEVVKYIKTLINTKVLYGGSVSTDNIKDLKKSKQIDGFLIGSDAMNSSNLKKIIEVVLG